MTKDPFFYHLVPEHLDLMFNKAQLHELNLYLYPGLSGHFFVEYSKDFLKILAEQNIFTFIQLKEAFDKVQNKTLENSTARQRQTIQGQFTLYLTKYKKAQDLWETLTLTERSHSIQNSLKVIPIKYIQKTKLDYEN